MRSRRTRCGPRAAAAAPCRWWAAASTVTFGLVGATPSEPISQFLIQGVAAPHAAGAVDVVVTTAGGTATATGGLTYV